MGHHSISPLSPAEPLLRAARCVAARIAHRCAAIGGESTGYAIATDDGLLVELEMSGIHERAFLPGRRVLIEGRYREIKGVEIPMRRVLVVETISAPY
jgi:hypothetical protein